MKRVLVGMPTVGLDPDPNKWLTSFMSMLSGFNARGFMVNLVFPYKVNIVKADNIIFETAVSGDFDYLLRIDDDIWGVPPYAIDRLLDADKDFISAVMYVNDFPFSRCAFKKKDPTRGLVETWKDRTLDLDEIYGRGVQACDLTATPFTLFKVSALKKLERPFFEESNAPPDSVFCDKCTKAGIQPYVHMDVHICHRLVTPWNRYYLFNAEARYRLLNNLIPKDLPAYKKLAETFGADGLKDISTLFAESGYPLGIVGQEAEKLNKETSDVKG